MLIKRDLQSQFDRLVLGNGRAWHRLCRLDSPTCSGISLQTSVFSIDHTTAFSGLELLSSPCVRHMQGFGGSAAVVFQRVTLCLLTPMASGHLDLSWCKGTAKDMLKGWLTDKPGCTTYWGVKNWTATALKEMSHIFTLYFSRFMYCYPYFCCVYRCCCRTGAPAV